MSELPESKDELSQKELFSHIRTGDIRQEDVVLVGVTLKEIDTNLFPQMRYNPFEMQKMPKEKLFLFYCDSGKESLENLRFYRKKLPEHRCLSLRGGRGYWQPSMAIS